MQLPGIRASDAPWIQKTIRVYVTVVGVGMVLGFVSGGLGGIFVLPLLLPWIAIVPVIELATGWSLLNRVWAGPLIAALAAGAINAYLLLWILRLIERRRRRLRDARS